MCSGCFGLKRLRIWGGGGGGGGGGAEKASGFFPLKVEGLTVNYEFCNAKV